MKTNKITLWVALALILGVCVGYYCHTTLDPKAAKGIADGFSLLTDIFLRMIKMIIGPLIFATLVHGIASSDSKTVGRVGLKAMGWFLVASLVSLLLGLLFVNVLHPGVGYNLPSATGAASGLKTNALNLKDFISHMFPKSFFEAMSNNEVLQIVVFSLFFGFAIGQIRDKIPHTLINMLGDVSRVMLKVTGIVMCFAPFGVFGAVASTITLDGLGILAVYARFLGCFILATITLWVLLIAAGYAFLGRTVFALLKNMRVPFLLGFATASSEAAYPKVLEQLEKFGVSEKVAGFVLPLGYSFNLDGSIMYSSFAALFIAQVYNIPLSLGDQITMLLVLLVTSKGIAGVPRAALVVVAAVLPMFHLPEAGVLLLLGIDHFMDMFRTATNVIGNALATTVVAQSENAIDYSKADNAEADAPLASQEA
jgi:Na+/H+-dicarboxylate symporter